MIRLGRYNFSPSLLMTVLYLAIGAAMIALGLWQLARADEKIALQALADRGRQAAPVSAGQLPSGTGDTGNAGDSDSTGYIRVKLIGSFEPARQFLWDNRIVKGRAGFEVISPFRLSSGEAGIDGKLVLVNRGWVAPGMSREHLPDVDFAAPAKSELIGVYTRPSIGFSGGDAVNLGTAGWPRVLQHFDYGQIASALTEPTLPGVVQGIESIEPSVPIYRDNWQPVAFGPARHYGYAFQWFAMFTALSCLYFYLNTSKNENSHTA